MMPVRSKEEEEKKRKKKEKIRYNYYYGTLKIIHWQFQNPSINLEINSNIRVPRELWTKALPSEQVREEPAKVTILNVITPI